MWTLVVTIIYLNTMAVTTDTFIGKNDCEHTAKIIEKVVMERTDNAIVEWTCVR